MPPRPPKPTDFPSHLTLTITHPTAGPQTTQTTTKDPSPNPTSPNILLLLHGLGDTAANFTSFARALNLPETTVLTLQAPQPLPFDLGGYHWGDDVTFTPAGELDMDAGFARAVRTIVQEVVLGTLVRKCGYQVRDVLVFGLGQGGMVGLEVAEGVAAAVVTAELKGDEGEGGKGERGERNDRWLSGVVSIGAPYPLSAVKNTTTTQKNRTPALLVAGRDSLAVTESAVRRTKDRFEFVEVHRYARRGDGMPRSREEMLPIMQFLARRLKSWKGVPEGSVEIS
ncbi:alpha/beta hydrolase [Aspergillus saccharolyticus JOP 1030-1]|uniref:Alpha/beta-hydrolase n=1 Tax=Aspergillus saccharolyticus JOP 1030-1 TaxID=1450539 RepID=A0A319AB43_9EURO|nr:alpha/beta-hydrolase [Aspergillus saccharolyticus JOP 1030-1]PYH48868.1 alpha/beta-hydrolase [Aspergillus saccharolyticus JOP 1030-1]